MTLKSILVTGDIVLDHHYYAGERLKLRDDTSRGLSMVVEPGGAALTQRLISAVFKRQHEEAMEAWKLKAEQARKTGQSVPKEPLAPAWDVHLAYEMACGDEMQCPFPDRLIQCLFPDRLKAYAEWKPTPKKGKQSVWRLGCGHGYGSHPAGESQAEAPADAQFPKPASLPSGAPAILVLDDAGADFRQLNQQAHWHLPPDKATAGAPDSIPQWIVLKLGGAVGAGDLWLRLQQLKVQERLVIVVSADVLRLMEVQLSPGLSWEQSAEKLAAELSLNPVLKPLRQCRHLVVTFRHDGAAWFDFTKPEAPATLLIFDPCHGEGEWCESILGEVFGYNTCLTAAVVAELAQTVEKSGTPDLAQAITRGLSAMRRLREDGHGPTQKDQQSVPGAGFPVRTIAAEIVRPNHGFARAAVPDGQAQQAAAAGNWSILAASQGPAVASRPLVGFARQLALRGEPALKGVPHLRIGQLLTASQPEMESLRLLRRLLLKYRGADPRKARPLSIGVFGAPGAGKSFGVRELAIGVFGEPGAKDYPGWMEFNLSQFKDALDLIGAFHQVRDRVLQGFIPVVFWDEFDSRNYFWLQYLLAPMQDGKFQEGQITHPIGKCVFIFAGATASAFDSFGPKPGAKEEVQEQFKLAKGPDFKSRLDASLNVLGPNPAEAAAPSSEVSSNPDQTDIFYPIRRAILLRALLGCGREERLDIDAGLLTALLEIPQFKHGARSLEKLLEPLKAARQIGLRVLRSQLPDGNQLALYVEPGAFHALCRRDEPFKEDDIVRLIAPAIHETWRQIARKQGWKPTYNVPYGKQLPPEIIRSNEAAARRMPENLALVGLRLVPGRATKGAEKIVREHLGLHVELLGEAEHNGWMEHLSSEGWRHGQVRDDARRLHDCLIPYRQLREIDREKDRDSVRHYPDFARTADWKIIFG